uniref:Uncharacterized protein n=2 Tax=Picea TaxID=3328 RepID=A0A101M127_PICGL|nr:hypothetical protein ABT39_MTgene3640 [Picea glauca]QHR89823.1 hypothetical protein Q903MT_gene3845 [Picea sitchensis]
MDSQPSHRRAPCPVLSLFPGLPSHPSISKLLWVSPEFSVLICLLQLKVKEWEQLTFGAQLFLYPIYLNALLPHPISSFTCLT